MIWLTIISWVNPTVKPCEQTYRQTYLYMWDRSRWGRPCLQQERPRGKKESGTLVWSACPSGIAGRRRLGEVQTHLRKATDRKGTSKHIKGKRTFEEALIHAGSCRAQSRFMWLRRAMFSLAEFSTRQFAISPFGCSCRRERQILRDIFQMHETDGCG